MPVSKFYLTHDNPIKRCGTKHVYTGRQPMQRGWYKLAKQFSKNKTVLDVGAGIGDGVKIIEEVAKSVRGIDKYDERLEEFGVEIIDIKDIPDNSYEIVVCIDVIEHVKDDLDLFRDLMRVATETVIVSTPNYDFSKGKNRCHYREYTPEEFMERLCPDVLYTGTGGGVKNIEIVNMEMQRNDFMRHLCGVWNLND